jgi:hypothetical protein
MAFVVKIPYSYGASVYIKTDPEQKEYTFIGAILRPGAILFILDYMGEEIEVYDFQVSPSRDMVKEFGGGK